MPLTSEEIAKKEAKARRLSEIKALEPISFAEFERVLKKWILITDPGITKLIPALIITNKLKRKPIWMFLIGPSGGGKTAFLEAMADLEDIFIISLLTPTTFLSGMPGKGDTSLLPKINNKILMFKDWTNILSQNKEARNEIMGQLRDIYDGHVRKAFGTGMIREWGPGGKIGLLAATTPSIDMHQQIHSTLGERFINYRIKMPDRKKVSRIALSNSEHQFAMDLELRNAFCALWKSVVIPEEEPAIPDEFKEKIINIANFSSMARSGVIREFSFKKEVIFVPAPEMPTRLSQQLNSLATAFIILNKGVFNEEDMKIIYKIALDSIPQTNYMVMKELARKDERTTAEIATSLGYPTGPIRMYLENLAMLNVCQRLKGTDCEEGGASDRWTLNREFVDIIKTNETIIEIEKEEVAETPFDTDFSEVEADIKKQGSIL